MLSLQAVEETSAADVHQAYRPPREKSGGKSHRLRSLLVATLVPQAILLVFTVVEILVRDWKPPAAVVLVPLGIAIVVSIKFMHDALWPPEAPQSRWLRAFMTVMTTLVW